MHGAFGLEREVGGTVCRECDSGEECNRYRIPVEQTHVAAWREICEEGHGERTVGSERNSAGHIARRGAEEDCKKHAGDDQDEIPESLPHAIIDVATDLQRHSAQYQTPQNEKERE